MTVTRKLYWSWSKCLLIMDVCHTRWLGWLESKNFIKNNNAEAKYSPNIYMRRKKRIYRNKKVSKERKNMLKKLSTASTKFLVWEHGHQGAEGLKMTRGLFSWFNLFCKSYNEISEMRLKSLQFHYLMKSFSTLMFLTFDPTKV